MILCLPEPEEQSKPGSVYNDNEVPGVFGSTDGIPEGSELQTADRAEAASKLSSNTRTPMLPFQFCNMHTG